MTRLLKRGQISTEYLIIVGFITFLVISLSSVAFFYTASSRDRIKFSNLAQFANALIVGAEDVYYEGEPSQRVLTVYLPVGVQSVNIAQEGIYINVTTASGYNFIFYSSKVPLAGSISHSEGVKRIVIVAQPDRAHISEDT